MTSQEINLTAKEYGVLEYLMRNKGKVLSKEQIEYIVFFVVFYTIMLVKLI
ncbi:winged helix-turn-helix domain-containing protein [Candidatus Nanosynbacter sp. HMT-352]|uniref:winged helix-turn-helix domain-containing protein n=1 Tax=unclassified Candidatus Nanosynbacter TaxID=2725944 RepID=UPI00403DBEFC